MDTLISLISIFVLMLLGYSVGSFVEKVHYASVKKRENQFLDLPAITFRKLPQDKEIIDAQFVMGSVVISLDYFKRFLAGLRHIVGGRIKSYETLLDRARREAILRMKEEARKLGADVILNVRFETAGIKKVKRKQKVGCFEVLAYGTAIKFAK